MKNKVEKKVRVSISVSPEILEFIEKEIEKREFATISHAFEKGIYKLMEEEKG